MSGPHDIVTAVEAALTASASLAAWRRCPLPAELLSWSADGMLGHTWSVAAPRTEILDARRRVGTRIASEGGMLCKTTVIVRWARRLRADVGADDYVQALEDEALVLAAVTAWEAPEDCRTIVPVGFARAVSDDGSWLLGGAEFFAQHLYNFIGG